MQEYHSLPLTRPPSTSCWLLSRWCQGREGPGCLGNCTEVRDNNNTGVGGDAQQQRLLPHMDDIVLTFTGGAGHWSPSTRPSILEAFWDREYSRVNMIRLARSSYYVYSAWGCVTPQVPTCHESYYLPLPYSCQDKLQSGQFSFAT